LEGKDTAEEEEWNNESEAANDRKNTNDNAEQKGIRYKTKILKKKRGTKLWFFLCFVTTTK
jgi:hypothetical protein